MTNTEYYHMRRENHQCVACGVVDENTLSGKCRCVRCAEINKQEMKNRKKLYAEIGRCVLFFPLALLSALARNN